MPCSSMWSRGLLAGVALLLAACAAGPGMRAGGGGPAPLSATDRQLMHQALMLMQAGRASEALPLWQTLGEHRPDLALPRVNSGIALEALGQEEAALAAYREAIEANPDSAAAWRRLARLQRRLGRFEAARETYRKALARLPGDALLHRNFGVLCELYLRDLDCAAAQYRRYAELDASAEAETRKWLADLGMRMEEQKP